MYLRWGVPGRAGDEDGDDLRSYLMTFWTCLGNRLIKRVG